MELTIQEYDESSHMEWDRFVLTESVNGTTFHTRNFLAYHPADRFDDHSILVRNKDRILAVIAVAKKDSGYFSHPGTTGGGWVVSPDIKKLDDLHSLVNVVDERFGLNRFTFRLPEAIFSNLGQDIWQFIFRHSHRFLPELSLYKTLSVEDAIASVTRARTRSSIRQVIREGFDIQQAKSTDEVELFYRILEANLLKFDQKPVHSLVELKDLMSRLDQDSILVLARYQNEIVGGLWLIRARGTVWHTQYIAKDYSCQHHGIMPALLVLGGDFIRRNHGATLLNYGICTEERGSILNAGLGDFKRSLGAEFINRYLAVPNIQTP